MVNLTHPFVYQCKEWNILLDNTVKLSQFSKKIIDCSVAAPAYDVNYTSDKYKGDAFEVFAEFFFKVHALDNRVGVYNYEPVRASEDLGVDGVGTGMNFNPATVQVKFRSDPNTQLKSTDLKQFTGSSIIHYDVKKEDNNNMIVFTNAKGMFYHTEDKMYAKKVRCLGNREIRSFVDNHLLFWKVFKETIEAHLS